MDIDWKDALSRLKGDMPQPSDSDDSATPDLLNEPTRQLPRQKLHVVVERKGRKGKTATIIEGFLCSDDELQEIARSLKQKIGTGGSARGGEILLQGDWRDRVSELLREMKLL